MNILEEWRPINGFNGYEVSNIGRVRSFKKAANDQTPSDHFRLLKGAVTNTGYLRVALIDGKHHYHKLSVHRLVAMAFVDNPDDLPIVNHKDENRLNNNACNLEWCTASYNARFGTGIERANQTKRYKRIAEKVRKLKKSTGVFDRARVQFGRPVDQLDPITGKTLKTWLSLKQIEDKLGFSRTSIAHYANGDRLKKTFKGYKWRWHIEYGEPIISIKEGQAQ